jgi:WS/DGAT/MGAT family acyltransferase
MTATDALFWTAESAVPSFRPIIGGLYVLDRNPGAEVLRVRLEHAFEMVPRLRQRVVEAPFNLGLPEWVDDPHFEPAYHLRHFALPEPGTRRQLLDTTAKLLGTPLDRERPLWETYWIEGLEGDGAAYFIKMHHSLVDGVGSVAILNALTADAPGQEPPPLAKRRNRAKPAERGTAERLAALLRDNADAAARLARDAATAPLRVVTSPRGSAEQLVRTARGLWGAAQDLATPAAEDPLAVPTSGLARRLDVMDLSLARLRKIKAPLGVTLNDLVLAVLTGAIAGYHRERRIHCERLNCLVPMNLRGKGERDTLGNRVGNFTVVLPVGERDRAKRLAHITAQTRAAKTDQRGASAPFLADLLALVPGPVLGFVARRSLGRINVACTNVPGLRERRHIGDAQVEAIYPFASVVEGTPVVVALLSYAGNLCVGIDTDPEAIPHPERIPELFAEELDAMEKLA